MSAEWEDEGEGTPLATRDLRYLRTRDFGTGPFVHFRQAAAFRPFCEWFDRTYDALYPNLQDVELVPYRCIRRYSDSSGGILRYRLYDRALKYTLATTFTEFIANTAHTFSESGHG